MVTKTPEAPKLRGTRLDMKLSVAAHAALARRICPQLEASRPMVINSMMARYADLMAVYHTRVERKFTAAEIRALHSMVAQAKHITIKALWLQDRSSSKIEFVNAVRHAAKDPTWSLTDSQTNKLLRILDDIFSTEEYFGLIDYLSVEPSRRKGAAR